MTALKFGPKLSKSAIEIEKLRDSIDVQNKEIVRHAATITAQAAEIQEATGIIRLQDSRIKELEEKIDALCRTNESLRWPPADTSIVSEIDVALRPDDGRPQPTFEQMITALQQQDYIVLTPVEIDSLCYVGGECPVCKQQVQP